MSIRNRIAAFLLAGFMSFILGILLFSTLFSKNVMQKYLLEYVEAIQKEMVSSIELTVDVVTMLTVRLKADPDIYNLFDNEKLTYNQRNEQLRIILDKLLVHPELVGNIAIVTDDGSFYSYSRAGGTAQWENKAFVADIAAASGPIWGEEVRDEENRFYIPYGMKFRNYITGQQLGYLIVFLQEAALLDIYDESLQEWGYSFIVSQQGYVLSHPRRDYVGKVIVQMDAVSEDNFSLTQITDSGDGKILTISRDFSERLVRLGCDWKIVSAVNYNKLFNIIQRVNRYLLIISLIMFLAAASLSIVIAKKINRPVQRIKEKLNEFGKGQLDVFLEAGERDEIWELEKSFNDMVKHIKELIDNNNREKEKQRELELIALQAQINPHFLYNTLDAIGWIAKIKKQDEISQMVLALARFFRLSLHKGDKFITVEEEIQLVMSFVQIEQTRSPEKFEINYDIPEEMLGYKIVKILLQPLVENALKHGIGRKRGKGTILVQGREVPEGLRFKVTDDGAGFDTAILNLDNTSFPVRGRGYGLRNVDERIRLEYGPSYGLHVTSHPGEGTTVEVLLKIID